ncbi:lactoylglutathione lyase-like [Arachis stenosperma]|uniref:lactoylglutathione lyase-like n=1 Tax=Arachis stenosperma TaxID=217475 RepID=UPI0025ACF091|nr:lactoylglutathione lyase-like [Arachis stenosperma]
MYRFIAKPQFFLSPNSIPFQLSHTHKPKKFSGFRLFSMALEPKELPTNNPGLTATPDPATKGYFMQQTMFRIKDPIYKMDLNS